MAVTKKDKDVTVSAATRIITVSNVKIIDGNFVDEEGNITERVAEHLVDANASFKITIKIELPEEEDSDDE